MIDVTNDRFLMNYGLRSASSFLGVYVYEIPSGVNESLAVGAMYILGRIYIESRSDPLRLWFQTETVLCGPASSFAPSLISILPRPVCLSVFLVLSSLIRFNLSKF